MADAARPADATPLGLPTFAAQDARNAALVHQPLAAHELVREVPSSGGASIKQYGRTGEIHEAMHQRGPRASDGVLYRLA